MSEKPEALRLAENLVNQWYGLMASDSGLPGVSPVIVGALRLDAAAELRRLHAENERLREALGKSLTHEQILRIAATIDRSMPLESAKILFARRIEAALRREET